MKIYALIYDEKGRVLITKKNVKSFYSLNDKTGKLVLKQNAIDWPDGGHYCFPGGSMITDGQVFYIKEALREFKEETGFDLLVQDNLSLAINNNHVLAEENSAVVEPVIGLNNNEFVSVYLCTDDLDKIQKKIKENLLLNRKVPFKREIVASNCPLDDELGDCEIVDITKLSAADQRYFGADLGKTDWFLEIVNHFKGWLEKSKTQAASSSASTSSSHP